MASTSTPPEVQKNGWPRGEAGTIDWNVVFEHPQNGLISLIEAADTERKLLICTRAIVAALFARKSDQPLRDEYLAAIDSINEKRKDANQPKDAIRQSVVSLLREIKDDRIERAKAHIDALAAKTAADAAEQERRGGDSDTSADIDPGGQPSAFSLALGMMIKNRIATLRCANENNPIDGKLLPFLVSRDFGDHLERIIVQHMGPAMEQRARSIAAQAEKQPRDKQAKHILNALEERKQREFAWDKWQIVWALMTRQSTLPKKPSEKPKKKGVSSLLERLPENKAVGGLLDRLPEKKDIDGMLDGITQNKAIGGLLERLPEKKKKKKGRTSGKKSKKAWKGEMTVEAWEEACRKIEAENARAKKIWEEIIQPSDLYQAPQEEDNTLLMNLFARTPAAMKKQIAAIVQIAEQGSNTAKVFSDFQQGKDMDAALLAACYQYPDQLMNSKKNILKEFMRSFPDTMRKERFSLVDRFLKDVFRR